MSGDNNDNNDFDNLMKAIREFSSGDNHDMGNGEGLDAEDSLEDPAMPSYEVFISRIEHDWILDETEINTWAWNPNISINETSWNDTPFRDIRMSNEAAISAEDESFDMSSSSTESQEEDVCVRAELEEVPMHWIDLLILLSIMAPLVAYISYRILLHYFQ